MCVSNCSHGSLRNHLALGACFLWCIMKHISNSYGCWGAKQNVMFLSLLQFWTIMRGGKILITESTCTFNIYQFAYNKPFSPFLSERPQLDSQTYNPQPRLSFLFLFPVYLWTNFSNHAIKCDMCPHPVPLLIDLPPMSNRSSKLLFMLFSYHGKMQFT